MSDVQIEFDLTTGKNDVNKALDDVKKSAKSSSGALDMMLGKFTETTTEAKKAQKETSRYFDLTKVGARESSNMFSEMASAAVVVTGAIAATSYTVKEFIGAAIESEQSVSDLNVALKQTGIYTDKASDDFQNLASKIQLTTIYSDDQAMSLESTLQNLGQFTNEGLKKATKASIELASAFNLDLSTAATLVGKAANGNTTAFGRMGIEIRKGKTDAETFANTLEALSRFEGASEAKAKTLGGSIKSLTNSFGELFETISKGTTEGIGLASIVIEIKNATNKVTESAKEGFFSGLGSAVNEFLLVAPVKLGDAIGSSIREAIGLSVRDIESSAKRGLNAENLISKQTPEVQSLFSLSPDNTAPQNAVKLMGEVVGLVKEENDLVLQTNERRLDAIEKEKKARAEARKDFEQLLGQIKNAGQTQLEIIERERLERLKITGELFKNGYASAIELADAQFKIDQEYIQKKKELTDKANEDSFKKAQELAEQEAQWTLNQLKLQQEERAKGINLAVSGASSILNGKEGARQLLSNGAGALSDMFAPGTGQAVGMLVSQLSQGPEATRAMVKEFAAAIPVLVDGLIKAIPVLIEELSKQFPNVIQAMSDRLNDPSFWEEFIKNMTKAATSSATAVPKAFIAQIPTFFQSFGKELINAIVNGFKEAVGGIGDVGGGVVDWLGGAVGTVGGWLGLARGGQVQTVPQSFPNDTFPAMLTSGELVVDRSTAERLNSFLDNSGQNESGSITDALLVQILNKLSEPINVSTSTVLNGRAFADIILELNRSNARVTA